MKLKRLLLKPRIIAIRDGPGICARMFLVSAVSAAIILLVVSILLREVFEYFFEQQHVESQSAVIDTLVSSITFDEDGRAIAPLINDTKYENPFSGFYWQVSFSDSSLLRSRSLWDTTLATPELINDSSRVSRLMGPRNVDLIASERKITFPNSNLVAHVVVASTIKAAREHQDLMNTILIHTIIYIGVIMLIITPFQVSWSLNPVHNLSAALTKVQEGEKERLEGKFGKELKQVAISFNALLAKQKQLIIRARETSGNLSHAMKTPLAVIRMEVEKLSQQNPEKLNPKTAKEIQLISSQLDKMEKLVAVELAHARALGSTQSLVGSCNLSKQINAMLNALSLLYGPKKSNISLKLNCPDNFMVDTDAEDLDEMLGNLLDNAFKWSKSQVMVEVQYNADKATSTVVIEDDGPGIPADKLEKVWGRGRRLDETVPGAGLGLAITRDLARLQGGDITLSKGQKLAGLRAELTLLTVKPFRMLRKKQPVK